jgi:hypothetical protein
MRTTVASGDGYGNGACRCSLGGARANGGADFPAGTLERHIAAGAGRPEDGDHATTDWSR